MCIVCGGGLSVFLMAYTSRRDFLKGAASASAAAALATWGVGSGAALAQTSAPDGIADIIFRGGPVLTMDTARPRAEALAVRGERILAVGSLQEIDARRGPDTRIVELDGRTLMPGMIDPHMHSAILQVDHWLDVSATATPDYGQVQDKLREGARRAKPGDWVLAREFDTNRIRDARVPTLAELDELVPDNPFFMLESSGHVAYANSAGLRLAGVTRETPDPSQGRFVRDPQGALTGRLEETPAYGPFLTKIPPATMDDMRTRIRALMDHASSLGCTSLHDCSVGQFAGPGDLPLLVSVMRDNPPVRYRGMLVSTLMEEWEKLGINPGHGDDRFRLDGVKAWSDGAGQARSAYQRVNYLGTEERGALNYTLPQLTEAIGRAHRAGWQVGVHANGDAAIDTVLEAFSEVLGDTPRADHRHRIEHCSMLHPDQIGRMVELGLSPTFLIGHIRYWGKAFRDDLLGPERVRFYDPCATALEAGLRISVHSDFNVTPIGPLRCAQDAVTRIMQDGGDVFVPEERIPVEAALRTITIDAAWQCRMDDIVGSLEAGKYADLALLEDDPTAVDPIAIETIKVSETWLAGERRHAA